MQLSKIRIQIGLLATCILSVVVFQNCGQGFETSLAPVSKVLQSSIDDSNKPICSSSATEPVACHHYFQNQVWGPLADLASQLELATQNTVMPKVSAQVVVGEGASATSQTFVRIYSSLGILKNQFLAYPSDVKGGVLVQTGHLLDDSKQQIVTLPIATSQYPEVRIFDTSGVLIQKFVLPIQLADGATLTVARVLGASPRDQILITAQGQGQGAIPVLWPMTPDGQIQGAQLQLPDNWVKSGIQLSVARFPNAPSRLFAYDSGNKKIFEIGASAKNPELLQISEHVAPTLAGSPSGCRIQQASGLSFMMACATGAGDNLSRFELDQTTFSGVGDVGAREKVFYIAGLASELPPEQIYVKPAQFVSFRTDIEGTKGWANGPSSVLQPNEEALAQFVQQTVAAKPTSGVWSATFQSLVPSDSTITPWVTAADSATQLPQFLMLNNFNKTASPQFFTLAENLPALDQFRFVGFNKYLSILNSYLTSNLHNIAALEIAPELEINTGSGSVGDYNPSVVRGFYKYLALRFGDLDGINANFQTPFTNTDCVQIDLSVKTPICFDPPRNLGRSGTVAWDKYDSANNAFFVEWLHYNAYLIRKTLTQANTMALAAGFPTGLLRTRQVAEGFSTPTCTLPMAASNPLCSLISSWEDSMTLGLGGGVTVNDLAEQSKSPSYLDSLSNSGFATFGINLSNPVASDPPLLVTQILAAWKLGLDIISSTNPKLTAGQMANLKTAFSSYAQTYGTQPRSLVGDGVGQIIPLDTERILVAIGLKGQGQILKAVRVSDLTWSPEFYSVPFTSQLKYVGGVNNLETDTFTSSYVGPKLSYLRPGDEVSIEFEARSDVAQTLQLRYFTDNGAVSTELKDLAAGFPTAPSYGRYRLRLRIQDYLSNLHFVAQSYLFGSSTPLRFQISHLTVSVASEVHTQLLYQKIGVPHAGGFNFAILEP